MLRKGCLAAGLLAAGAAHADEPASPSALTPGTSTPAASPEPAVLTPPALVACPEIPYPAGDDLGSQHVTVTLLINEQGLVETVTATGGVDPFAALVVTAVKSCTFKPATEGGEPVAVEIPFSWDFPEPPVDVSGRVRAAGDRHPIVDLALTVADHVVHTDNEGKFTLHNIAPGHYEVRTAGTDWRLPDTTFDLADDKAVDLDLYAVHDSTSEEAIGTYHIGRSSTETHSLTRDQVRTMPGTLGDPVRALSNLPGVLRTPFDAGWLLVRGGGVNDTGVFLDGVRIPMLYHLGGTTSILHPEMVDAVNLYPGAYSPRYGDALSGAVDLVPRQIPGRLRAVGGFNVVYADLYAEAPIGKVGGVAVSARRSYLDGILTLVLDKERARIAPRFTDYEAKADTKHFGVFFMGMHDSLDAPTGVDGQTVVVTQDAQQLQGRAETTIGGVDIKFQPWMSWQKRDVSTNVRQEDELSAAPGARLEFHKGDDKHFDLVAGADAERSKYTVGRDGISRTGFYGHASPYLQASFGDKVRATAGLRYETLFVTDQYARGAFAPRGTLRWQALPQLSFVAEAGSFYQMPQPIFLIGFPDGPYLPLEHSTLESAGFRLGNDKLGFDADGFLRQIDHIADFERDGVIGALQGRAYGIESLAHAQVGHFDARVMVQYIRSFRREKTGDAFEAYRYDVPMEVEAVAGYQLPWDLTLSARWRYSSGYYLDPNASQAYDILTQKNLGIVADANGRLPPFHALDVKISKRFTWHAWRLDVFLDVENAYDRRVPEPTINGIDDTNPVYGFGLPILPIFGVHGEFWP